jgi:hypothetical protein
LRYASGCRRDRCALLFSPFLTPSPAPLYTLKQEGKMKLLRSVLLTAAGVGTAWLILSIIKERTGVGERAAGGNVIPFPERRKRPLPE